MFKRRAKVGRRRSRRLFKKTSHHVKKVKRHMMRGGIRL